MAGSGSVRYGGASLWRSLYTMETFEKVATQTCGCFRASQASLYQAAHMASEMVRSMRKTSYDGRPFVGACEIRRAR